MNLQPAYIHSNSIHHSIKKYKFGKKNIEIYQKRVIYTSKNQYKK